MVEEQIVDNLRNVFDPEISVNVYDLGLIYEINVNGDHCDIVMTLTSAFCPAADMIVADVIDAVCLTPVIETCNVDITFDPPFGPDKMSEEVKMMLGVWE